VATSAPGDVTAPVVASSFSAAARALFAITMDESAPVVLLVITKASATGS
jgi:hypothetical protein